MSTVNTIWKKWLNMWAVGVVLFGLLLAATASEATDGATRALLTVFGTPLPDTLDQFHRFAFGLMGAVSMGWGLTFLIAFSAIWRIDEKAGADAARPYWRMVLGAMLIWYVVDGYVSVATGIWPNAISNTVLLLLVLVPLIGGGLIQGRGRVGIAS